MAKCAQFQRKLTNPVESTCVAYFWIALQNCDSILLAISEVCLFWWFALVKQAKAQEKPDLKWFLQICKICKIKKSFTKYLVAYNCRLEKETYLVALFLKE